MTDSPERLTLEEWAAVLTVELGLSPDFTVDIPLMLDLARDAAHGVTRPAAPVTTFLVGFAAGLAGGTPEDIARAAANAMRAVETHAPPPAE